MSITKGRHNLSIACMNISDFYKDERVSQLNKRNTIFEILSLKEENTSNILDWLLDPKESHGAGNAFAMHLLKACADKQGKIQVYGKNGGKTLPISLSPDLFKKAFVYTEYEVKDYKNGPKGVTPGRIDILAIDPDHDLCLVIENKYGSSEHGDQCRTYVKALKQLCEKRSEMKFIFIFLDVNETTCSRKEFINLSYDNVIDFKDYFSENTLAWRILDSLEKDVNGIDTEERLLKELCNDYGDLLTDNSYDTDLFFKKGRIDDLYAYEYAWSIKQILKFKKFKNKVYEVRHAQEFYDFLNNGKLDFWEDDYAEKGKLTFSRPCFCNENNKKRWAVYGQIEKAGDKYKFSIIYYAAKDDDEMQKKLKKYLSGNQSHVKKYVISDNIKELFKYAGDFLKDLNDAEKFF